MMLMVRSAFIIPENAEKGFVHARANYSSSLGVAEHH